MLEDSVPDRWLRDTSQRHGLGRNVLAMLWVFMAFTLSQAYKCNLLSILALKRSVFRVIDKWANP